MQTSMIIIKVITSVSDSPYSSSNYDDNGKEIMPDNTIFTYMYIQIQVDISARVESSFAKLVEKNRLNCKGKKYIAHFELAK